MDPFIFFTEDIGLFLAVSVWCCDNSEHFPGRLRREELDLMLEYLLGNLGGMLISLGSIEVKADLSPFSFEYIYVALV